MDTSEEKTYNNDLTSAVVKKTHVPGKPYEAQLIFTDKNVLKSPPEPSSSNCR